MWNKAGIIQFIDRQCDVLQVDLWQPNCASLIHANSSVDVHVGQNKTQWLRRHLQQAHIHHEYVFTVVNSFS